MFPKVLDSEIRLASTLFLGPSAGTWGIGQATISLAMETDWHAAAAAPGSAGRATLRICHEATGEPIFQRALANWWN